MEELQAQQGTTRRISELASDVHPEQMPEARRELTICAGAFEGVLRSVNELLDRVRDYTRDSEPAAEKALRPSGPVVRSPYGRELRSLSESMGDLEERVCRTLGVLEL